MITNKTPAIKANPGTPKSSAKPVSGKAVDVGIGVGSSVPSACCVKRAATVAVASASGVFVGPSVTGVFVGARTGVDVLVGAGVDVAVGGSVAVEVGVKVTWRAIAVNWACSAIAVLVALISATWVCWLVSLLGNINTA